jgi:hypothetical protein
VLALGVLVFLLVFFIPRFPTHFRRLRGIIAFAHPAHRFDQSTHALLRLFLWWASELPAF